MQHYYFQGQYYTCSFLELHIFVLFLTSDRASCTVASSTLFTNTPKLQLLTLRSMSCHSKKKSNFNYPVMAFFTVLYALVFCRFAFSTFWQLYGTAGFDYKNIHFYKRSKKSKYTWETCLTSIRLWMNFTASLSRCYFRNLYIWLTFLNGNAEIKKAGLKSNAKFLF